MSAAVSLELVAVAFAGGAFGAAIGALPSFSLAGLVVIVGELYVLAGQSLGADAVPLDLTGSVGLGPVLGPHVAFAGGAAALAYAVRRGYLPDGVDAKAITRGLGTRPDVLAVGGVFGVVGYAVAVLASTASAPVDPVALGVVGSALAHRVALGYAPVGVRPGRWLGAVTRGPVVVTSDAGASPESASPDGGTTRAESAPVTPWLSYQTRWRDVLAVGLAAGVLGTYVAYLTASPFLAFGISVFSLVLLCAGVDRVPVTHHVTLPASTAALALAGGPAGGLTPATVAASVPLGAALVVGAAFGVLGAVLGEAGSRLFYEHAETHLDPPAASIVGTSIVIGLLAAAGLLPSAVWIPTP